MSRRIVVLLVVCAVLAGVVPLVMVLVNGQLGTSSAHVALTSPVMLASPRVTHASPLSATSALGATVVARAATTTPVAPLTPTARQEPTPAAQPTPTQTAPPWSSITLASRGISVGVPPGWKASTSDFTVTIVNAAVRQQADSRTELQPNGVLFLLQPWDGPPPTQGQTVTVGQDRYPGRLETPTTKPRSAGAASAVRIAYTVGDYTWDIEGEFGSAVGPDSSERTAFNQIVQSIRHSPTATEASTPVPVSEQYREVDEWSYPSGFSSAMMSLSVDPFGGILVAGTSRVLRYDADGTLKADWSLPSQKIIILDAVTNGGSLYILEFGVNTNKLVVFPLLSDSSISGFSLNLPVKAEDVASDGSALYARDNERIYRISWRGEVLWSAVYPTGGWTSGMTVNSHGILTVAGMQVAQGKVTGSIAQYDSDGHLLHTWSGGPAYRDVAVDSRGNWYLLSVADSSISVYNSEGAFKESFGRLTNPEAISISANDTIYVSDSSGIHVFKSGE